MNFILEKATTNDSLNIVNLVNAAYRGEQGWTKESDLVAGDRVDAHTIEQLLGADNIHFLVAYSFGHLLCCICIEQLKTVANIGFFAVNPKYQELGIGKMVLKQAEDYVLNRFKIKQCALQVISQRKELISFYVRRGYKKTKFVKPYPTNINSGTPSIKGLTIDYLEKKL